MMQTLAKNHLVVLIPSVRYTVHWEIYQQDSNNRWLMSYTLVSGNACIAYRYPFDVGDTRRKMLSAKSNKLCMYIVYGYIVPCPMQHAINPQCVMSPYHRRFPSTKNSEFKSTSSHLFLLHIQQYEKKSIDLEWAEQKKLRSRFLL